MKTQGVCPLLMGYEQVFNNFMSGNLQSDRGQRLHAGFQSIPIQAKTKNHGETPLHIAVQKGKLEVAKILIDRGAQIEARNNIEITPLHWAVDEHHLEIAEFLIEKGAQIEAKGKNGLTLLHKAANSGDLEMAKLLIDKGGAKIDAKTNTGWTPLHYAVYQG